MNHKKTTSWEPMGNPSSSKPHGMPSPAATSARENGWPAIMGQYEVNIYTV